MVLAAGLIPQISLRAACLPEATQRCQRLSAFVCHLNPVSASSPRTLSRLCHSAFPSAWRSETLRQCKLATPPQTPCGLLCGADSLRDTTNTRSRCLACFGVWLWRCMCERHVIVGAAARKPGVSPRLDVLSDSVSEVNPGGGSL